MTWHFDTLAIHGGQPNDPSTGAINVPVYQTSTFGQIEPGVTRGFDYARTNHPTRKALEENLAGLEGARHGVAFASGMAAINGVVAALLSKGDHVVSTRDLYGGAWRIFTKLWARFGVEFTFVDTTDPANVAAALRSETKLLWLDTPSNPLLKITDISACASAVRDRGIVTVVDNTFATPCLQRPLELGADVVLHSTTKYINGHSDALGGVVITDRDDLDERLRFFQNAVGAVPGPQDCFLIARGVKTLGLRVERHCDSAERIANHLDGLDGVKRVHFPGLASHPSHLLARKQMKRFGAVIAIELDLDLDGTRLFARSLRLWTLAESLGGVKSLVSHPATMTHASVEPEVRREVGIGDSLLRLSVGLEDPRDLIADLEQALALARRGTVAEEVSV